MASCPSCEGGECEPSVCPTWSYKVQIGHAKTLLDRFVHNGDVEDVNKAIRHLESIADMKSYDEIVGVEVSE